MKRLSESSDKVGWLITFREEGINSVRGEICDTHLHIMYSRIRGVLISHTNILVAWGGLEKLIYFRIQDNKGNND